MPIIDTPAGTLEVTNAILSASEFRGTQKISVSNSAPTKNFSVGDKFHVSTTDVDAVNITGNLVAQKLKIGNLLVSPTFDLAAVSNVGNTTSNTLQFANATTGFTTTANVEIGGNITLTSNAQVKVGSNVLAEYTGPHGREPKEMSLKKFPEIAFDPSKFDANETTNTFIQAGYTVSSSSVAPTVGERRPWSAFDGDDSTHMEFDWTVGFYSGNHQTNPGFATTNAALTENVDGSGTYRGEWLQIELPKKISLTRYTLGKRAFNLGGIITKEGKILGSNDGTNWITVYDHNDTGGVYDPSGVIVEKRSFQVNSSSYYKYFRLATNKLFPVGLNNTINMTPNISEWELYGTEEPAPSGDLSLDTTLKSTFNSVRSNNYVMYFDGEDPAAGNVPKYLPSGSAKSITPNNVVFDATNNCWTLNGSTESNVTTGSLGFEGDAPHTVSTWINASNLEANATTQQLFSIGSGYSEEIVRVDDTQIAANTWHNVTYAYQGEGGSKVTYVDGRKVEETQVEDTFGDYPPFAMTDYKFRGYVVSVSDSLLESVYRPFSAFNDGGTDINNVWHTPPSYTGTSSEYVGIVRLATNVDPGHWIKLETPHKLQVSYMTLVARPPVANPNDLEPQAPKDFQVCGSNDDVNWDVLASFTGEAPQDDGSSKYAVNAQRGYKYLALAVNKAVNSTSMTIANISYYGHKEGDLTRFPEPTRVLKYPHVAFPNSDGTAVGSNGAPSVRGYVATTDDANSSYPIGKVFDEKYPTSGSDAAQRWQPVGAHYPSNGAVATSTNLTQTTLGNGTTYRGNYIQLESPHKLVITKYQIYSGNPGTSLAAYRPTIVVLLGSNTGNTNDWVDLGSGDTTLPAYSGSDPNYSTTATISNTADYKYHRLVIRAVAAQTLPVVFQVKYFGTEEDTGTPAIVGGPFAGKVANFRVYDQYLGDERIQEIYDAQKDEFGHKKSSMTFYKGRVGVGTTEPEGDLTVVDEPHALAKFPSRAVSANDSYVEGDGQIKLSAADGSGYQAFDGLTSTSWTATPERYTRVSEEVDFGAWLKIQTPESMSLKKAEIESKPDWAQVGGDILGSQAATNLGISVDCTHDGTRIIAGSYQTSSSPVGEVRVYDWNGATWVQVGNTITGPQSSPTQGYLGYTVAISGDGSIIAAGAPFEDPDLDTDKGTVRVFYLSGSTWTILPDSGSETTNITTGTSTLRNDIFVGAANSDQLGRLALKLSYDGKTILMTARNYDDSTAGTDAGQARIYTYSNGAWSKKGDFLVGSADDHLGYTADMSEDGNCIILSGYNGTDDNAWIYIWNGSSWVNRGASGTNPAFTRTDQDAFGQAVSINNDGTVIAFGLVNGDIADGALSDNGGIVQVYHWSGSAWVLKGTLHNKDATDDEFGSSVDLSGDGKRIIVGAKDDSTTSANNGRLYTFEYNGSMWARRDPFTSIGISSTVGDDTEIGFGPRCVAISRDGSVIVSGEFRFNSTNGGDSGRVRVFNMPSTIKSIWGSNDDVNWTKITTAPTREEATSNVAGLAFGYDDRLEFKNLDNPNYYKYHAIVADAFTQLKDVKLFGVRNQGSSTLHDGALTLTKNLDVPRIGPPLDADDTPRRDRLVVEYNTSTNPMEDGLVQDTSGRGNDGAFYGGASYDATEKALVFDGSGDYIKMRDWNYGTGFVHSFSGWVKIKSPEESWTVLYGVGDAPGAGRTNFTIWALTSSNFFRSEADGSGSHIDHSFEFTGNMDKWMHVAVVKSGAAVNTTRMYINGEILPQTGGSNATSDIALPNSPQNFTLGTYAPSPASEINADYSNIKFYDTALTAEEVKTLYDMGRCDEGHHVVNFNKTRVGIGLGDGEAPRGALDVKDNAFFNDITINNPVANGNCSASFTENVGTPRAGVRLKYDGENNSLNVNNWTDDVNIATFKRTGNVGIGITNPPAKLFVKTTGSASMGGAWSTNDFVVSHGVGTTAPSQSLGVAIGVDGQGDVAGSRGYLWCLRPNLTWNTLKIQGNNIELIGLASVTLNGGANVTSDDRLKTEETFIQNALPTIMKLKPQTYRKHPFLPNDPSKEVTENMTEMPSDLSQLETGLIVQDIWYDTPELRHLVKLGDNANPSEVRPVDPDPNDPTQDPDYSSWGTTPTTLGYQGVFVVAIKAIQELNTELQVEKAKVTTLETQLTSVLARLDALESA